MAIRIKRKNRRLALGALVVALALTLALVAVGCGDEEETTTTAAPSTESTAAQSTTTSGGTDTTAGPTAGFTMGYAGMFLTDPFQVVMQNLVLKEATAQGIKALEPTNANGDAAKQITDIQTLVDQGIQALMIIPVDAKAIVPGVEYAVGKGVPVVTIDTAPDGGNPYMVVRANNVLMGKLAAQTIGTALGGKGKVLEIQGDLASSNGRDRSQGFQDEMKASFPEIVLISRSGQWKADEGTAIAQTVLTSDPDVAAIFMASDSVYLPGVLSTLDTLGKAAKVGEAGHIFLTTIDGTPNALQAIRDGKLDASVSQPVDGYAKYGVKWLMDAVAGIEVKEGPTDHNSEVVFVQGTMQDLLPSPVVTIENVDDPNLWANQAE